VFGGGRDRVVIAGAGACAASAAETLRAEGYDGQIVMVGREPEPPYERPLLTREFLLPAAASGPPAASRVRSARWFADNGVDLVLGTDVTGLSPQRHRVRLSSGRSLRYGKLLIATGGRPRRMPHADSDRVLYLRTRQDARELGERLATEQRVAVLGAGFIGSEVAAAARARGIEVTLLDARDVPLQRSVGRHMARTLGEIHRSAGVEVRTGERALAVRDIPGGLLVETNRDRLECGLLLVALGMRPNTENFAAPGTGIAIANGIVVDEFCRTSVPDVFAAGDVAEQFNPLFGRRLHVEHFDNAVRQGRHAALNMLGRGEPGREALWFWSDQYDHTVQSVGDLAYADEVVVRGRPDEASYSVFHLRRGAVRAVLALNRPRDVTAGRRLVAAGARLTPDELRDPSTDLRAAARALHR
jgi:3-phenylpropionate/trans-cinnamate dioxygenase ferredoxin reductase subunit